jgi:hypothetical protein
MPSSRTFTVLRSLACAMFAVFAATSSQAEGRFAVSADGQQVTDTTTKLTWRRCVEGMQWDGKTCTGKPLKLDYGAAKRRAKGAGSDGGSGWRVPTRNELVGLVDRNAKAKPRIDATAFPKTPSILQWASRPGTDDNLNAWLVSFQNGKVTGNVGESKFGLRLVRDGS